MKENEPPIKKSEEELQREYDKLQKSIFDLSTALVASDREDKEKAEAVNALDIEMGEIDQKLEVGDISLPKAIITLKDMLEKLQPFTDA